jgi:hypothetical protein
MVREAALVVFGFGVGLGATAGEVGTVDGTQGGEFGKEDLTEQAAGLADEGLVVGVLVVARGWADDDEDWGIRSRQSPPGGGDAGVTGCLLPSGTGSAVRLRR